MMTEKIVFTNGCFDILHVGHIRLLAAAKALGDKLIVGLNDDASFKRHKGRDPILPAHARREMLLALESVDKVLVFDEDTPEFLIREIRPDVLVKGGDYQPDEVLGREHAGEVFCLDVGESDHTSDIFARIRQDLEFDLDLFRTGGYSVGILRAMAKEYAEKADKLEKDRENPLHNVTLIIDENRKRKS